MPRWLVILVQALVLVLPTTAPAAESDILRLVPKEAGLVLVVDSPRKLIESLRDQDAWKSAQTLPAVREALDSTQVRRFFQLVAYYEREMGSKWPDLLDRLAGNGLAVGVALGADPAPALLVVRGTDEQYTSGFYKLALAVLEQELARQTNPGSESPAARLRRAMHDGVETVHVGDDFHAARVGPAVFVANKEKSLHAGIDAALSRRPGSSVADRPGATAARTLLGGDPLAWGWLDLAKLKESQASKDFFAATRKDFLQTVVLGSSIDAVRRADFLGIGLYRTADGFRATVRLPARRIDLPAEFVLHAPAKAGTATLPLLEPPGVFFSQSLYLDLATLWTERKTLFNDQALKDFEKGVNDVSKVLPGMTFGQLLEASGPHHRFVAADPGPPAYKIRPDQPLPAMALVSSMRDPKFGKMATAAIRAGALLATVQLGMKMAEEKHDDITIVTYRFSEGKSVPNDLGNLRFNFVPCFAVVDDHLVLASRPELMRSLIAELRKPADASQGSTAVWRGRAYGAGAAAVLRSDPDPQVTTTILGDGVGLEEAKRRVAALTDWLAALGSISFAVEHGADAYQVQLEWKSRR